MPVPRPLPDPDISLRESRDFIMGSALARRALGGAVYGLPVFVSDLVEAIHRLVHSCHLPEFTDHGLPHLCSLVDRISHWGLASTAKQKSVLPETLKPPEAATLLVAALTHDLGMLSQNAVDLPVNPPDWTRRDVSPDTASWVRHTHVIRLPKLIERVFHGSGHGKVLGHAAVQIGIQAAKAHQQWPWEWSGEWQENPRNRGMAAVIAVADLLDEDAARCDTRTLLQHRDGNELNRAHWLRHALTAERLMIVKGTLNVRLAKPPDVGAKLAPVYSALRNHFRLVAVYQTDLESIGAGISNIQLDPCTGVPSEVDQTLGEWDKLPGFANEDALCFQLLRTFMPEALKDARRCDPAASNQLRRAALEDVNLDPLHTHQGEKEPRTSYEETFSAIAGAP